MKHHKEITCFHCGKKSMKQSGSVNRAIKNGSPVYCNKICFGLANRVNRSIDEKKRLKAEYDARYRKESPTLKQRKAESFKRNYDPKKAAEYRKGRMKYHVEYCRNPEYKEKKKVYDEQYRAKKFYGEYWEAFIVLKNLTAVIPRIESKEINQLNNKSQKRRRCRNNSQPQI